MDRDVSPKFFGKNREKLRKIEQKEMNTKLLPVKDIELHDLKDKEKKELKESKENKHYSYKKGSPNNFFKDILTGRQVFTWLGLPTKYDELSYYSRWWKFLDVCITVQNMMVFLLCTIDYEQNYSYPRAPLTYYTSLRIWIQFINIGCIVNILFRHWLKHKWSNVKLVEKINVDSAYEQNLEDEWLSEDKIVIGEGKRKFLQKGLFFDILLNLILPYPYLDYEFFWMEIDRDTNKYVEIKYLFSDVLFLMVIMRAVVYLVRAMINYSMFYDHYAQTLCKEYNIKCNLRFVVKCILKTEHVKVVLVVLLASVYIFGLAIRVLERPYWNYKGRVDYDSLFISMWMTIITMMTVGYGDYSPYTYIGKLVCTIAGLWGTFINSLIIVCLSGLLELGHDQFIVFINIIKTRTAIKFIERAYDYHQKKVKRSRESQEAFRDVLASYYEFKGMRNESKSIYRSNGLLYYDMKILKELKKINNRIKLLEMKSEKKND